MGNRLPASHIRSAELKWPAPDHFLNYNGNRPRVENDRPAINVSGPQSSVLQFFYKFQFHIFTKINWRFWHKTCLKWLFKLRSTDEKPFCPNILCFSNKLDIFLSNYPMQIVCSKLIFYIPTFVNYHVNSICKHYIITHYSGLPQSTS